MNESQNGGRETPERVIVLRALQLGDMLCSVPALRSLRAALPDTLITLVGLPWARSFVERFSYYVDDFIEFPGFPGLPEQEPNLRAIPRFLHEVQWLECDLAIQMHGSGSMMNAIVSLFGARQTAGYAAPGSFVPLGGRFMPYPEDKPEIMRHLALMEFLGFPSQGVHLEFPLYPEDWSEYAHLQAAHGLKNGSFVVMHPGSRAHERRWSPARFAAVADRLARSGFQIVLTGTEAEHQLALAVQRAMKERSTNLAGKTSLGSLAALLSSARLLVCNDTGVSHIAAALLTPSVVLFSASDPLRWAPLNERLHRQVAWAGIASPEAVMVEIERLLQKEQAYAE